MSHDMSFADWEQYTGYPIDNRVVRLQAGLQCANLALDAGASVFEISLNRRINHFEAKPDEINAWLDRLADDILEGAHQGEPTPRAVVHYGTAAIGSFRWQERGFTVVAGAPLPGDLLRHPIDRLPLTDDGGSPRQAMTAAIHTLDLLRSAGYEV